MGSENGLWHSKQDVLIQDQHTPLFDAFFTQQGSLVTLAVDALIDAYEVTLTGGHGTQVGDFLVLLEGLVGYGGEVLAVNGDVISLDMPLSFTFTAAGTGGALHSREMNVNGSGTRQTFSFFTPSLALDVTRIMVYIADAGTVNDFPDDSKFGNIDNGITRGLAFRLVNDNNVNFWNAKTNGDLANLAFDADYTAQAKNGFYGYRARYTLGGQSKHGVTIRMRKGDTLEMIVQDDLTDIDVFRCIAEGHVVD